MRIVLMSLLLASTAAAPAWAQRSRSGDDDRPRAERSERREASESSDRPQRAERQQQRERVAVRERAPAPQANDGDRGLERAEAVRSDRGNAQYQQMLEAREARREVRGETAGDSVRDWRQDERRAARDARGGGEDRDRAERVVRGPKVVTPQLMERRQADNRPGLSQRVVTRSDRMRTRGGLIPAISHIAREGTQPPPRAERPSRRPEWRDSWRHDRRYNWWQYRERNRSFFHLGAYYDPFGWGYQPYSIGWRMWPSYYGRNYWLNDPWMYRLPYAPAGYRWIRYWDDAVLVDTWDGRVVDVIHNFFW